MIDWSDRFWQHVHPEALSGCWLWHGAWRRGLGYGSFRVGGKNIGAHRAAYALTAGSVPDGMDVRHRCGVRLCVNPDHLYLARASVDVIERFAARLDKSWECWLWTGTVDSSGYGQINRRKHKSVSTHRLAYEHYVGQIPSGLEVMHTCDTPRCCNPEHLKLGTHADNIRDMYDKYRVNPRGRGQWRMRPDSPHPHPGTVSQKKRRRVSCAGEVSRGK